MHLIFIDPQQITHRISLLSRSNVTGFYTVRTADGIVLSLHYSQIQCVPVSPESLDALLEPPGDAVPIRHGNSAHAAGPVLWSEWPPPVGSVIECRGPSMGTILTPHSAIEVESLRQCGYTEWRLSL